jgi:hypothetical protein
MTLVRELGRVAEPAPETMADVRHVLLEATTSSAVGRRPRRWLQHRALTAAAAVVLVSGSALAGYELTRTSPSTNTTIECGTDTYIPVTSGDPVADCHAALARDGGSVPPLAGWVTPTGLVVVLPRGQTPPTGATPLPSSFQVDAGVRFLTDALADQRSPLSTSCLSSDAAVAYAQRLLDLTGLLSWRVATPTDGGGSGSCATYAGFPDPSSDTVVLSGARVAAPPGAPTDVGSRLDARLAAQLSASTGGTCATTASAMALAERDASELGIAASTMSVSDAGRIGGGPTCARAFVDPAGFLDVLVWQVPAGA